MFRGPDSQLGFIFMHFTMGELLSFVMILVGIVIYFIKLSDISKKKLYNNTKNKRIKSDD